MLTPGLTAGKRRAAGAERARTAASIRSARSEEPSETTKAQCQKFVSQGLAFRWTVSAPE